MTSKFKPVRSRVLQVALRYLIFFLLNPLSPFWHLVGFPIVLWATLILLPADRRLQSFRVDSHTILLALDSSFRNFSNDHPPRFEKLVGRASACASYPRLAFAGNRELRRDSRSIAPGLR